MSHSPEGAAAVASPPGRTAGPVVRAWAVITSVAITAAALARVLTVLYTGWAYYGARAADPAGRPTDDSFEALDTAGALGLVALAILLVAGATFLVWLYLARTGTDPDAADPPRWGAGWTIGAWFVPVANLVLPPIVVADLWRATTRRGPGPVPAWWSCAAIAVLLDQAASAARSAGGMDPAGELDALFTVAVLHTVESVFDLAAAALIVFVVLRISARPGVAGHPGPRPGSGGGRPGPGRADGESAAAPRSRVPGPAVLGAALVVVVAIVGVVLWAGSGADRPTGPPPPAAREVSTVPVGGMPGQTVASPDGRRAYVSDGQGRRVVVLDSGAAPTGFALPGPPKALAISSDGGRLFVSVQDSVLVLDASSGRTVRRIALPDYGDNLAVSPDGRALVVSDLTGDTLVLVDLRAGRVTGTTRCPRCEWVTVAPDSRTAYALSTADPTTLTVVDIAGRRAVRTLPTDAGTGSIDSNAIAAAPGGPVYLAKLHTVAAIDPTRGTIGEIGVEPGQELWQVAASADGRRLYVAGASALFVLDAGTRAVLARVPLGAVPDAGMAVSRDGRTVHLASRSGVLTTLALGAG